MTERIAVVTGATGGMGREIVADLARTHHVYALGRDDAALAELGALAHVTPVSTDLVADLLDAAEAPSAIAGLLSLTRIDVLVHAAAVAEKFSVESARVEDWRSALDINVVAAAELTRVLLPAVRVAQGTVVFINSGAGRHSYADNVIYAATKHALYALADGLRKAESVGGVRVTTIAPGPTDTPMLEGLYAQSGQRYDADHFIDPVEIARALRTVVDAGPTTQITDMSVRPRIEVGDRK